MSLFCPRPCGSIPCCYYRFNTMDRLVDTEASLTLLFCRHRRACALCPCVAPYFAVFGQVPVTHPSPALPLLPSLSSLNSSSIDLLASVLVARQSGRINGITSCAGLIRRRRHLLAPLLATRPRIPWYSPGENVGPTPKAIDAPRF